MKKIIPVFILSLFVATVSAQENDHTMCITLSSGQVVRYNVSEIDKMWFEAVSTSQFPVADDSKAFSIETPAQSVRDLLTAAGPSCTGDFGYIKITDDEYAEIKAFTDELVNGIEKEYDIYRKCYTWVTRNIKYGLNYENGASVDNEPYPVFTTKTAVCQGYANLLFIMLHSQGIPAMAVNGVVVQYGQELGHAWNYVYCGSDWYVSDPTNEFEYEMNNEINQYANRFHPKSMNSVVLFKDNGISYNFDEFRMNICRIESKSESVVIPYSINGFRISLLRPDFVSSNVKEVYVGDNIESFGDMANGSIIGLRVNAPGLEAIHVSPDNKYFRSHEGVVYSKDGKTILIVPSAIKRLELLPLNFGKDASIEGLAALEEIYFPEGTGHLGDYSVSDCPKLTNVYLPKNVIVSGNAFYNCPNVKIKRY